MEFNKINKELIEVIENGEKIGEIIKTDKNIIIELAAGIPEYVYSKHTRKIKTWKEAKETAEQLHEFNLACSAMNKK